MVKQRVPPRAKRGIDQDGAFPRWPCVLCPFKGELWPLARPRLGALACCLLNRVPLGGGGCSSLRRPMFAPPPPPDSRSSSLRRAPQVHFVFLIDTSASMNQRTQSGLTYLDLAKHAIENFLKVCATLQLRDPAVAAAPGPRRATPCPCRGGGWGAARNPAPLAVQFRTKLTSVDLRWLCAASCGTATTPTVPATCTCSSRTRKGPARSR